MPLDPFQEALLIPGCIDERSEGGKRFCGLLAGTFKFLNSLFEPFIDFKAETVKRYESVSIWNLLLCDGNQYEVQLREPLAALPIRRCEPTIV